MNHKERLAQLGEETVNIVNQGYYVLHSGNKVNIKEKVNQSIQRTELYSPKDTNDLLLKIIPNQQYETVIEITNETTLAAAKRLLNEGTEKVIALNFASARNPGGGFLKGSTAQEESLSRASSLYHSLISKEQMYEYNRKLKTCLYSDYMIYTPGAVVFRNDSGKLEEKPYHVSFITSPAVNAGVVRMKESIAAKYQIHPVMKKRIEKILSLGIYHGYDTIVLGAFGCGVFKNNPADVARYFKEAIYQNPKFKNQYKRIVFAVLDTTDEKRTYNSFKQILG